MAWVLRFFDDYGSGWLWAGDVATLAAFDVGPLDEKLADRLTEPTRDEALALSALHWDTMNWDEPQTPLPLSAAFCEDFNARVTALFHRLQSELGPGFRLLDQQHRLEPYP